MLRMRNIFLFTGWHEFRQPIIRLPNNERGVAAIEFAIILSFAAVGVLNAADLAVYARDRLEVENAAAMGAQAALKTCDLNHLPATTNCSGLASAVTAAVQSTGLGSNISLAPGSPSEAYYCVNSSNALAYVSGVSNKPADCSSVGMPNNAPGDYIEIQTGFSYVPMFPGSVTGAFPAINKAAWMRLG